jgi:hypothetical protein
MAFAARAHGVFRRIRLARSATRQSLCVFLARILFFLSALHLLRFLDPGLRMLVSCVISISYSLTTKCGVDASKCE